jgi:pyruvate dehydrogenase (quinone)
MRTAVGFQIAAHIPRDEIGSGYFQETHPQELFRECSVYVELVSIPEQLPQVLEIALRTALERRGVAVVVIPGEVFLGESPAAWKPRPVLKSESLARPDDGSLAAAAEVLNRSSSVTILAGAGCAGAHDQLIEIAAALKAPVVHAMRGKEFVEYDNPYDVGMTGLLGFSSGYRAMEHCDALLMLGTDFPYRQFYPEGVPVIQVDIRGEQIGRRVPVDVSLVGTVKDTIDAMLPLLAVKSDSEHLERMTDHYRRARARLDRLASAGRSGSPLHPQLVAATIDRLASDDAIFTADVGTPTIWAARYLHMNGKRRLLGSFNHGTMANALPQAIGAQASQPGRQVVSFSGDGGLAMLLGELITLRQQHLPVKVVVFNNQALAFVELEMKAAGIVNYGTDLDNPDFAALARSIGLLGETVKRADELEGALQAAFAHDGPALIDVHTARQELACRRRSRSSRPRASRSTPRGQSSPEGPTRSSSWRKRTSASWPASRDTASATHRLSNQYPRHLRACPSVLSGLRCRLHKPAHQLDRRRVRIWARFASLFRQRVAPTASRRRRLSSRLAARADDPCFVSQYHGLHSVAQSELVEDSPHVSLDRGARYDELLRDLGVR